MITSHEISLAQHCIRHAVSSGASAARVSLNKTVTDSYTILNGELDKVSHSADRSIYIYLFADGRYGTFSTNRLEQSELEEFVVKAIEMVRMLLLQIRLTKYVVEPIQIQRQDSFLMIIDLNILHRMLCFSRLWMREQENLVVSSRENSIWCDGVIG